MHRGKKKWVTVTPGSYLSSREHVENYKDAFVVNLKLIHYHTLVHPAFDSAEYRIPPLSSVQNLEEHPEFYIGKFGSLPPLKPKKSKVGPVNATKAELVEPSESTGRRGKQLKQSRRKLPRQRPTWNPTKPSINQRKRGPRQYPTWNPTKPSINQRKRGPRKRPNNQSEDS